MISLLRHFVNEYPLPISFAKRIHNHRFHEEYFQLVDETDEPVLSLECGKVSQDFVSLQKDWIFIPLEKYDKGIDEIIEIYVDTNRSGWCIPLSSIVNKEKIFDRIFLSEEITNALDAATIALILDVDCIKASNFTGNSNELVFGFNDFYNEQFAVALIYKPRLPSTYVVDGKLSPQSNAMIKANLTSKGYIPKLHYFPRKTEWSILYPDNKMKLASFSADIRDNSEEYMRMLIQAAESTSPVETYFFLIQIMESLGRVLWKEGIKKVFDIAHQNNPNYRKLRATANWVAENKTTYEWIVKHTCDGDRPSGNVFNDIANDLITKIYPERQRSGHCSITMSTIRHIIVHSHSNWANNDEAILLLHKLNSHFFSLITEILSDFSVSKALTNLEADIKSKLGVKEIS